MKHLDDDYFVCVSTSSTGPNPRAHQLIAIGLALVDLKQQKIIDKHRIGNMNLDVDKNWHPKWRTFWEDTPSLSNQLYEIDTKENKFTLKDGINEFVMIIQTWKEKYGKDLKWRLVVSDVLDNLTHLEANLIDYNYPTLCMIFGQFPKDVLTIQSIEIFSNQLDSLKKKDDFNEPKPVNTNKMEPMADASYVADRLIYNIKYFEQYILSYQNSAKQKKNIKNVLKYVGGAILAISLVSYIFPKLKKHAS